MKSNKRSSSPFFSPSRRDLLKTAVGLAAAQVFGNRAFAGSEKAQTIDGQVYDCIVIGAGTAGLTAARQLANARSGGRALNILVLEGSHRIGGRMHTLRGAEAAPFGESIELGSEYIHIDRSEAHIWEDVDRYQLKTKKIPKIIGGYIYDPQEFEEPKTLFWAGTHSRVRDSSKMFDDMNAVAKAKDMSAAQMMATLKYSGIEYQMADMLLGGDLTGPLDRLSVQGFVSDKISAQLRKWDDYSVVGGYDLLLQNMVAEIGAQNIRFGHPVKAIRPLANGWVQIQVPVVGWFTARTALCTASIGALHARKIDFGPFWTSEKEASLRFIDTFDQSKFAIRFKERFWPEDMTMLHHALSSERKAGRTYFVANYDYGSVPPVLTAYITGEVAQRFHAMTDKDILQLICADLDKIYPALAPTYNRVAYYQNGLPIVYRKQWIDDPFSHGGMSFLQTGEASAGVSVTTARLALASAQNTKPLFWAGEATETETQPACVHGAHNSGLRASREILNHLLRG